MDGLTYGWAPKGRKDVPSVPCFDGFPTPWRAFAAATGDGWTWGEFTIHQVGGADVTADEVLRSHPLAQVPQSSGVQP